MVTRQIARLCSVTNVAQLVSASTSCCEKPAPNMDVVFSCDGAGESPFVLCSSNMGLDVTMEHKKVRVVSFTARMKVTVQTLVYSLLSEMTSSFRFLAWYHCTTSPPPPLPPQGRTIGNLHQGKLRCPGIVGPSLGSWTWPFGQLSRLRQEAMFQPARPVHGDCLQVLLFLQELGGAYL